MSDWECLEKTKNYNHTLKQIVSTVGRCSVFFNRVEVIINELVDPTQKQLQQFTVKVHRFLLIYNMSVIMIVKSLGFGELGGQSKQFEGQKSDVIKCNQIWELIQRLLTNRFFIVSKN